MNTSLIVLVYCLVVSTDQRVLPGLKCTRGSFMNAKTNSCQPCTPAPEDYNAVVEYACNSTHDVKYRCKESFFNSDGAETLVCQKCRECNDPRSFVVKNCSAERDTECRPSSKKIGTDEPNTPDNKTNVTGLTCGRNTRLDLETKSCIHCDPCTYVDHDLHSQQTCDHCSGGNNYSNLVDCPKKCFNEEYPYTNILRALCVVIVAFVCLLLYVLYVANGVHSPNVNKHI